MQVTATLSCLTATLLLSIPCQADLVAHWKIDEATGVLAADHINNHNGSIAGTAVWNTVDLPPVPSGTNAALELVIRPQECGGRQGGGG